MEKVAPCGLEPQTLRLLAVRSNQRSYETLARKRESRAAVWFIERVVAQRRLLFMCRGTVSERLRRWTRNPLVSARRGLNALDAVLRQRFEGGGWGQACERCKQVMGTSKTVLPREGAGNSAPDGWDDASGNFLDEFPPRSGIGIERVLAQTVM